MHPIDELLSMVGCVLAFLGILAGILCSHPFVYWVAGFGLGFMLAGLGLDKWREWKREQKEKVWW